MNKILCGKHTRLLLGDNWQPQLLGVGWVGGPSSTLARHPPLRNNQCLYPQSETIRLISHTLFVFLERQNKTLLLYYKRVIQVGKQYISSSTKEKLMLIT